MKRRGKRKIRVEEMAAKGGEIKEFHCHVYWLSQDPAACQAAEGLRCAIVERVRRGDFVAVCHGVTAHMLPGLDESKVPPVNRGPVGPHASGSYEVWVPREHLASVISALIQDRGDLTVLVHPLTDNELRDHTSGAMWLGQPYPLNISVLSAQLTPGGVRSEYPELGLGYASSCKS